MATRPTNEPITMGNYADLPPEQRPGYFNHAQGPSYANPATTGATSSPGGITYAQPGNVQYSTSTQQFAYTAAPATQNSSYAGPTRTPSAAGSGYQYSPPEHKLTYTSKPVVSQAQPPPTVRHSAQPANQQYQQPTSQQYQQTANQQYQQSANKQYQQPAQYTPLPHAPPPPAPVPPQQAVAQPSYPPPPMGRHSPHPSDDYRAPKHAGPTTTHDGRRVVEMVPGGGGGGGGGGRLNAPSPPGKRPHSLSVGGNRPDGLTGRMDRLSVSGNRPDIQTIVPGGMPPPSPLLEAYHGTYQSISPMPQAMMLDDDLDHLPPLDNFSPRASGQSLHGHHRGNSRSRHSPSPPRSKPKDKLAMEAYGRMEVYGGGRDERDQYGRRERDREREHQKEKEKRRVRIYDATGDALALASAMSNKQPDTEPIIDILPALSHDQMLELRNEYKRHMKVQGHGINIAKHIKLKTTGNFGKIAYVTALGKYEGEGYWANYWYQSNSARRELLIEALMGRQNHEIRSIKDAFKDKRYSDSLTKCMDKELKADKFRKAVLMALEGERQEESDVWSDLERNRDVDTLYRAIKARDGGESAMLSVVIQRSDGHLRDVLRAYERKYQGSFARDALRKSNNLVGEVIAHILNGVINRPARDAMLLHHALIDLIEPVNEGRSSSSKLSARDSSSKHERQQRFELLISRLVRLHWDRNHLMRVKSEYEEKYGRMVEEDLEEATKGDFREFCIALCQTGR
ncbi:hypothetical protein GQ44DRAFT_729903 [Phaeosphaeriaceae sp. PMI808]|nr:hypothetical protein GQ44DRAFT_729903 [Phaeosphaeriaceae sp. PMI808]